MNDEHSPVSAADYIELFRLVNEIAWRIDHGRADTVWQLFAPTGTLDSGRDPLVGQDRDPALGRRTIAELRQDATHLLRDEVQLRRA